MQAWKLLKNLSGDTTNLTNSFTEVTADQVATQRLLNNKTHSGKTHEPMLCDLADRNHFLKELFSKNELTLVIFNIKADDDKLQVEHIINIIQMH